MFYQNKKTGVIVDSSSTLLGAWEPIQPKAEPKAKEEKPKTRTKKGE